MIAQVHFENRFSYNSSSKGFVVVQLKNGGYLYAGTLNNSTIFLAQLDSAGTILQKKQFSSSISAQGGQISVIQTSDNGYALLAFSTSGYEIIKLDASLTIQWVKPVGSSAINGVPTIIQSNDGGFILESIVMNAGFGDQGYVVKLQADGTPRWAQRMYFSKGKAPAITSIAQSKDGAIYVSGAYSPSETGHDLFLARLDTAGKIEWSHFLTDSGVVGTSAIIASSDGGCIIAGNSRATDFDALLLKCDSKGDFLWAKTINGFRNETCTSLTELSDGDIVSVGTSNSSAGPIGFSSPDSFFVVRLAATGALKSFQTLTQGGSAMSVVATTDGGCAVAGYVPTSQTTTDGIFFKFDSTLTNCSLSPSLVVTSRPSFTIRDSVFLQDPEDVKTGAPPALLVSDFDLQESDFCQTNGVNPIRNENCDGGFTFYPNPLNGGELTISKTISNNNEKDFEFAILSTTGITLYSIPLQLPEQATETTVTIPMLPTGAYVVSIRGLQSNMIWSAKMVKQ